MLEPFHLQLVTNCWQAALFAQFASDYRERLVAEEAAQRIYQQVWMPLVPGGRSRRPSLAALGQSAGFLSNSNLNGLDIKVSKV